MGSKVSSTWVCHCAGIYDPGLADLDLSVGTEESLDMVKRLAREDGLPSASPGAAMTAALRVARGLAAGVVVVIFPDGGSRYLSERFWDE
jgi:cysteine synthase